MQKDKSTDIISEATLRYFLISTLIFIILLSLPLYFSRGIGMVDDTNFLIIAKWIGQGLKPYNDLIELKPPGIYYTLHTLKQLFGEAWWVSRIFILSINLLFVYLLVMFMSRFNDVISGLLSGIIFYPSLMIFGGYRVHTENFCALIGLVALGIIFNKKKLSLMLAFLFGIVVGISTLFKQPGIFYLVAFQISLLVTIFKKRTTLKESLKVFYISSLGFLIVWLITLVMLYREAMLDGFLYAAVVRPLTDKGDLNYRYLIPFILVSPLSVLLVFATFAKVKYKNLSYMFRESDLLWLFVFLLSLIPVFKRTTPHYLICAIFPIPILGVKFWIPLVYKLSEPLKLFFRSHLRLQRLSIFLLMLLPALPSIGAVSYGSYFFIREDRIRFDRLQTYELGSKIVQFSQPSQTILCIAQGPSSRIYYILEQRPPLKYIIISINNHEKPGKFRELMALVKEASFPVVILVDSIDERKFTVVDKSEIYRQLSNNYKPIPLRYAIDPSRELKTELFVLKDLSPVSRKFKSKIFP